MKYNVSNDLKFISSFLSITYDRLANLMDIPFETISRIVNESLYPSDDLLEKIYSFIFDKGIKLNQIKVEAYKRKHNVLLFHGSKSIVVGKPSFEYSRKNVDFGVGFYLGDNYEQSLEFISQTKQGNLYVFSCDYKGLKILELDVSLDWMLYIAYCRQRLEEYSDTAKYQSIKDMLNDYDVVIAPIADNRMFTTIDDFVNSAISSKQAMHALKDLSLGKQIVFKTKKALKRLKMLETLYVCKKEKALAKEKKIQKIFDSESYIVNAYKTYKRQGLYIEEIFNDEKDG